MLEGIFYRLWAGIPRWDLPDSFGSRQTAYTWHNRLATDGTWTPFFNDSWPRLTSKA